MGLVWTTLQNCCAFYTPTGSVWESHLQGIHSVDATLGGWRAQKVQGHNRHSWHLSLHCTPSFSQSLYFIKASPKTCEPQGGHPSCSMPYHSSGLIHLRRLLLDCHKKKWTLCVLYHYFIKRTCIFEIVMPCPGNSKDESATETKQTLLISSKMKL